jgi:glutamate N-acetyltransferase / amino-acid N-acetyltransferase
MRGFGNGVVCRATGIKEVEVEDIIQCPGFKAAGVAAGIKKRDVLDLGLIYSEVPANAAGVFTRNRVKAAPVILSQTRLAAGKARAIIANAGNANCCTGPEGLQNARLVTAETAARLNLHADDVLPASTGVIGLPLPVKTVQAAIPELVSALRPDGFGVFSRSIMTTDTVPKLISRQGAIDGRSYTMVAAAKGAGMIRPDMATMLCFICSDVGIEASVLEPLLRRAVDRTLNRITIDGDTSTNDSVFLMANGLSGAMVKTDAGGREFEQVLEALLWDIARRLVKDGEGVTKVVDLVVRGASSDTAARRVADTVAHSPLVKTAFFGEDANWGRIMGAVGRSGVAVAPDLIDLFFDAVQMVRNGQGCGAAAETQVAAVLKKPEFSVTIDLHQGSGAWNMLTCDFSVDYVKINADYRS